MCKKCNGTGIITTTDYVPYGSTSVPMDSTEFCLCTETECPACGVEADNGNEETSLFEPCKNCGWDIENQCYAKAEKKFDDTICLNCVDGDCENCKPYQEFNNA